MGKPRTKEIPFANKATEVKPGVFRFTVGDTTWQYDSIGVGVNLGIVDPDDDRCRYQLRLKNLDQAACFAEGFNSGVNYSQPE